MRGISIVVAFIAIAMMLYTSLVVEVRKEIILFQLVSLIVMGIIAYIIMRGGEKEKCEE